MEGLTTEKKMTTSGRWVRGAAFGLVLSVAWSIVGWTEELPSDEVGGSWYGMAYFGRMTDNRFHEVVRFSGVSLDDTKLYAGEVGYRLHDDNFLVDFLDPVLSSINVGVNVAYQDDPNGDIYQVNPFIMARWSDFPWNNYLRTTVAFAEGLSFSSEVPATEIDLNRPNRDYKKLVNYLAAEVTFSLPKRKDWELVYRLHHRSGVFGLFGADNSGSTAMGVGIRHYFK